MGLITSAWGGAKIQSWMSKESLHAAGEYDALLALLDQYATDRVGAGARFGKLWETWWHEQLAMDASDEPWSTTRELKGIWRDAPAALGAWETWGDPELAAFNGMVWYRTTVQLTAPQAAQSAVLALGSIDEVDQTWVNGQPVGSSGPDVQREYALPRNLLKTGANVIVVNALDTYGAGGMYGPAQRALRFADGSAVLLKGPWRYRITANMGRALRAPWDSVGGLTTIHNGMIAPLGAYTLRGALWYQGESNTEEASRYQSLLGGLVADWRKKYGTELPFLVVQLANYGQAPTQPGESTWAELREAQRLTVTKDPRAGLVITVDIGDRYDIHPANKQEVGRRLARAARRVVYGEAIAPSGPVPLAARRQGSSVVVTFGDITKRLIAYGADGPIGFELCGAGPGSCRYANAVIQTDRVVLDAPNQVAPVKVRYCWANSPVCTLYDESHLPAGPFEIKVE
jgi:sialate O-acetylesterase